MIVRRKARNKLKRLLNCRRGTAEIVGSIMFLLILLFFFTNVYLWHDVATREMDDMLADRMNSRVSIEWNTASPGYLTVTNNGGVGVVLSRLWIIDSSGHNPADLDNGQELWIAAGETMDLYLVGGGTPFSVQGRNIHYVPPYGQTVIFKILTSLGNTAACEYTP